MFDFSSITEVTLSRGAHDTPASGMCFMEMTAWFAGEDHSDKPDCACPVLGRYGIKLNDNMPDDVRDRLLKPLVPLIAGTRDKPSELKRAEFLAMWATNKILPVILRERGFTELAGLCERAKDLSEAKAAAYAANAAYTAAYAADAANAAATNAAYAAAAAYAADAADAAYTANAAYAAANAADAANAAATTDAANAADAIWNIAVDGLRKAILIGRHEGFTHSINLAERHADLKALVAA